MNIKKAEQSAFTPGRWLCDLTCGHQQWVVSERQPDECTCTRCPRQERQETRAREINEGSGQGETSETGAFKDIWRFEAHCRGCGAAFEVPRDGVHVSLRQVGPFTRQVLLAMPEVCPVCKNLQVAGAPPAAPPEPPPEGPVPA